MVSRFRRTLSFPIPSSNQKSEKPVVRSVSLPSDRSNPLISQLKDEITELSNWESSSTTSDDDRTSAWLCQGLNMMKNVHESVSDLLHLTQTQESLRRRSNWVEKLLEDYLRFVDVYGIFRASIVSLKEEQLEAQMAIRRKDEAKIDLYVKGRRKMDKEMRKLVSEVRSIKRNSIQEPAESTVSGYEDDEASLAGVLRDVNEVTVLATICVIKGVSATPISGKSSWMRLKLWKKEKRGEGIREVRDMVEVLESRRGSEDERRVLRSLEECIGDIEKGSERVFRSLINTRVSLLNILTSQRQY